MIAKTPISAQNTANALKKCSSTLNEAADIIKDSISLSNGNLEGNEFDAIRNSLNKLITNIADISNSDIPSLLTILTNRVNEYNDNLVDEEGNKIKTSRVNYNGSSTISTTASTATSTAGKGGNTSSKIPNTKENDETTVSDNTTTTLPTTNQNETNNSQTTNNSQNNNSELNNNVQNNNNQTNVNNQNTNNQDNINNSQNNNSGLNNNIQNNNNQTNVNNQNTNNQNQQSSNTNYIISDPANFTDIELNQIFNYITNSPNIEFNNNTIINFNNNYYKWEDIINLIIKENNYNNYINNISISNNIVTILTNNSQVVTFNNISTLSELKSAIDDYIRSL